MRILPAIWAILLISFNTYGQEKKGDSFLTVEHKGDCQDAIPINTLKLHGSAVSADNHGDVLEFKGNPITSLYYFQEEHHTIWYKFKAKRNAYLTLNIKPDNEKDNYDFILYHYDGNKTDFCDQIKDKKLLPIRSNISRNDISVKSQTGLTLDAQKSYVGVGIGDPYSAALKVKQGEIYYLVIDNIHGTGGYQLEFRYYIDIQLSGKIKNKENHNLLEGVKITLEDFHDKKDISETLSNKQGFYQIENKVDVTHLKYYKLHVFKKGFFPSEKTLNNRMLHHQNELEIDFQLSPLEEGKTFAFEHINFEGDSDVPLQESYEEFKKLYLLMKINPNLKIRIEGHTNGCHGHIDSQWLSEARAKTIKKELIKRGIIPERISTIGFGCSKMLFPNPKNWKEMTKNMRVEIRVIKNDKLEN